MEHVTGEDKYDWEILRVDLMMSSNLVGRVCCVIFNGFFREFMFVSLV